MRGRTSPGSSGRIDLDLPPGEHELAVRAWDETGQTQTALPDDTWNYRATSAPRGTASGSWWLETRRPDQGAPSSVEAALIRSSRASAAGCGIDSLWRRTRKVRAGKPRGTATSVTGPQGRGDHRLRKDARAGPCRDGGEHRLVRGQFQRHGERVGREAGGREGGFEG